MCPLELFFLRLITILCNSPILLHFLLRNVDEVVGGFSQTTALCFLKHLRFLNDVDPVVVVLAPNALLVVLDVRVIMSTLGCSVMDCHTVQMVWHVHEG